MKFNKLKLIRKKIYYSGPYKNWAMAQQKSTGYESDEILEKVKKASLIVKERKKGYERDSKIFFDFDYDYYLLRVFKNYSKDNDKILKILDFGGSIGSFYFKYKDKIKNKFIWSIVEQKNFVHEGKNFFENNELNFFFNIEDYEKLFKPDIIILSSSIQYIENYKKVLNKLINLNSDYIIILKTPFNKKNIDEVYVQKPDKSIYKSTYPSWILGYDKFISNFDGKFILQEKTVTGPKFIQLMFLNLYFKNKNILS